MSWRLEFGANSGDHSDLPFTTLGKSGVASKPMSRVSLRWNPSANGYQSFDSKSGRFLEDMPSLKTPVSSLR
jgi:hypothetical protein